MALPIDDMSAVFKLLGDKTRLTIISLLKGQSELCVCEIVDYLHTTQPNVSQHLRKLKSAGLVSETRRGQWIYYALTLDDKPYLQATIEHLPTLKQESKSCDIAVTDK
ncbi:ArsR/SmtB family transcription factor [Paenibacillus marinisediminis]